MTTSVNESTARQSRTRGRHRALLVAASCSAVLLIASCGGSGGTSDAETPGGQPGQGTQASSSQIKLVRSGNLTICGINNYPPMEFVEGQDLKGFDVDVSKKVAEKLGLKHDWQVMAFEGIMPALQAGRCDVGWSAMYLNDDRQKVADAVPYLNTTAQALVAKGNPLGIQKLEDLSGKRAAIDSGTSNLAIAKDLNEQLKKLNLPPMKIQEYPKTPDTFQQIRVGRADVVIDADLVLGYLAKQEPEHFEYVRFQDVVDGAFALYVTKGSPLKAAINEILVDLKNDGTLTTTAESWGLDPKNLEAIKPS